MIESIRLTSVMELEETNIEHNVRLAMRGDKKAYSCLILNMEQKLYRISKSVLKNDADCADAMQEALIRAWLKLPTLRDIALFEHWLVRILLRECYRITKKAKWASLEVKSIVSVTSDPTCRITLEKAIYSLKMEHRIPLVLHHLVGYKVSEISEMLNIPEGTVKSRLMRGRKTLRSMLKEDVL